jgi:uncharacterized protein DUF6200
LELSVNPSAPSAKAPVLCGIIDRNWQDWRNTLDKENTATIVVESLPGTTPPIIVDLGSRKKKAIKRLKKGRGKLTAEVALAIEQIRASLPEDDKNKLIIPVLVIYREKKKRKSLPFSPLSALSPFNLFR